MCLWLRDSHKLHSRFPPGPQTSLRNIGKKIFASSPTCLALYKTLLGTWHLASFTTVSSEENTQESGHSLFIT